MATDFPNSPANGATHTFGGTTYTYDSSVGAWTAASSGGGGGASVTVSETAPSSPSVGDFGLIQVYSKHLYTIMMELQINGYKIILQAAEVLVVAEHL